MKIWIHINGKQEGPFEEHELPLNRMDAQTPVWYEGLAYWTPAITAPVTSEIIKAYLSGQSIPNSPNPPYDNGGEPIDVEHEDITDQPTQQSADEPGAHSSQQSYREPARTYGFSGSTGSYGRSRNSYQQPARGGEEPEKQPPTYMVWSIILTVLCCNPVGIVAIVLGSTVNSKYYNYDYEGARRRSELTAWWLIITIVTSLVFLPFSMLLSL